MSETNDEGTDDADERTDPDDPVTDPDHAGDVTRDVETGRTTAPMSPYTTRDVGVGFLVLALGIVIAFLVPLLATL